MNNSGIFRIWLIGIFISLFLCPPGWCQANAEDQGTGYLLMEGRGGISLTIKREGHDTVSLKGEEGSIFELPAGRYGIEELSVSDSEDSSLQDYPASTRTLEPVDIISDTTETLTLGGPLHYQITANYQKRSHSVYFTCHDLINEASIEFRDSTIPSWEIRNATGSVVDTGKFVPG